MPSFEVKYSELRTSFGSKIDMLKNGIYIDVIDNRKPIAVISLNTKGVESAHTVHERDAAYNLRPLFDLVAQGKDVVIKRLGDQTSILITKPAEPR